MCRQLRAENKTFTLLTLLWSFSPCPLPQHSATQNTRLASVRDSSSQFPCLTYKNICPGNKKSSPFSITVCNLLILRDWPTLNCEVPRFCQLLLCLLSQWPLQSATLHDVHKLAPSSYSTPPVCTKIGIAFYKAWPLHAPVDLLYH